MQAIQIYKRNGKQNCISKQSWLKQNGKKKKKKKKETNPPNGEAMK